MLTGKEKHLEYLSEGIYKRLKRPQRRNPRAIPQTFDPPNYRHDREITLVAS